MATVAGCYATAATSVCHAMAAASGGGGAARQCKGNCCLECAAQEGLRSEPSHHLAQSSVGGVAVRVKRGAG